MCASTTGSSLRLMEAGSGLLTEVGRHVSAETLSG